MLDLRARIFNSAFFQCLRACIATWLLCLETSLYLISALETPFGYGLWVVKHQVRQCQNRAVGAAALGHGAGAKASLPGQCCEGQCPWLALAGAWETAWCAAG